MTREEAIRKLQKQKAEYLDEWVDFSGVAEAYDMAIEALQNGADLISRADAIKAVAEHFSFDDGCSNIYKDIDYYKGIAEHILKNVPSAEADRPSGEWTYLHGSIGSYMTISCPFCGKTFNDVAEWEYNYCPSCGARMKGGDTE